MPTTWNPSDKHANVTLSNGDLTATVGGAYASARATLAKTSGKAYFEVTLDSFTYGRLGIATSGHPLDEAIGAYTSGWAVEVSDGTRKNGGSSAYGTGASAGDVMMVAVDLGAGKIWIGKNGTWFDTGDPAAGTNPMFTDAGITNVFPAISLYTAAFTANFGASAFSYTPPTGFDSGWDEVVPDISGLLTLPTLSLGGILVNPHRFMSDILTLPILGMGGTLTNPSRFITGALTLPLLQVSSAIQKNPLVTGRLSLPLLRVYAELEIMEYVSGTLEKNAISPVVVRGEGSGWFVQSIPGITSVAASTYHPVARLEQDINAITLDASAFQEHIGTIACNIIPITLSAQGHEDSLASLTASIPLITLTASAIAGTIGNLGKSIGALLLTASAHWVGENNAILTIPAITLHAEGSISDAEFIALVLNTKNFGLSKYTAYGYNSLCIFNGKAVGAKSDGIYELAGDTDDGGETILWKLKTGKILMHSLRLREMLIFGKISSDAKVVVETAGGLRYEYDIEPTSEKEDSTRVKVGKGLAPEYLTVELMNESKVAVQIDKVQGFGMKL